MCFALTYFLRSVACPSLPARRVFKRLDKNADGKIDIEDLMLELAELAKAKGAPEDGKLPFSRKEAAMVIWEVDDDNDKAIDWEEFHTTFHRARDDKTGCEPHKLFHVIEFLMHDKNGNGMIDVDECLSIMYARYGRVSARSSPPTARTEW